MSALLAIIYGFYFIMVGVNGNAPALFTMMEAEKQFLYWCIVLLVMAVLWESPVAEELAKSFCFLVVIGFLLSNQNGLKIIANAKAILPGIGGSTS